MTVRRALLALALLGLVAGLALPSGAAFTSRSANPGSTFTAVSDWVAPSTTLLSPGPAVRGTVTLTAIADDLGGSGVASVRFERALADSGVWTTICTDATAPYTCAWSTAGLTEDAYDLRTVATDKVGLTGTSEEVTVDVDNTAPASVSVTDPGSPIAGVVTVGMSATDDGSGIATVRLQRAPAGSTTWTDVCTDDTAPFSCRLDTTTMADGLYDLRAIATDEAGNTRTSATVAGRRVDNTKPSVSLDDPGSFVRGTVALSANASSGSGVTSVTIQRAPSGSSTWTTICADTTAPYGCSWATTGLADGAYDLRAVLVTGSGASVASATISTRVDNTLVRGVDVQATNRTGGTRGRLETGDQLRLTWSDQMRPSTLVPGWDGTGTATLQVRLRDSGLIGLGASDTLQLLTGSGAATGLGSVDLKGNYIRSMRTVTFAATATAAVAGGQTTVTVTLGAASGGGLRTASTATMAWTPSSAALDLAGNASSTSPVTESGTADVDF
ncbi:Ig-like domain-containing protein [Conexibacter sp. SYSU D00693]|uniref:Ig-like domain-containing protein n=1 Tax=Conexibacter sp. SYSU D00693 TaxID=2812560 RepID=UPI00196B939E|nr:Ig-like domain-containing protein [Conexibacter sp. SYSU D00693]